MGLTKPRASQIYNLDYKQATRVVTTTNITLSGGAPSQVDGVNLAKNDRVLVTGQSTSSQNGLYDVVTVGTGSNGTWTRTSDANSTGEIDAGMIIMVTEGAVYHDTQWKLITDDPIVIGSTALTFTQNYSANSINGGSSNVTVYSNANVTISSAGTPNVVVISSTGEYVLGQISATGNITGDFIFGNGSQLTGLPATYSNANVQSYLPTYSGNIGELTVTGNLTVTGTTITFDTESVIGNIIAGNVLTSGLVSATGNITTEGYYFGNGSQLTGFQSTSISNGNSNVNIATSGGNIEFAINGVANTVVVSPGELTVYGVFSNPKTITSNVIITDNINSMMIGPIQVAEGVNIYVPDSSTLNIT